jgi:flotillin
MPYTLLLLQTADPDITLQSIVSMILGGGSIVLVIGLFIGLGLFFASRYKVCPTNRLLVISGATNMTNELGEVQPKVIAGGGTFVWPIIQQYNFLDLAPFTLKVALQDALSAETIRVAVPSAFTLAVGNGSPHKENAATRLVGKTEDEIKGLAAETIVGTLRQVIAVMSIQEINSNRDEFRRKIESTLVPELTKLGLALLNVNIQDLRDESGYLDALGKKAGSEATQRALGDVAEAERTGAIRVAEAQRDKDVVVAAQKRDQVIGVQEAQLAQTMRLAEMSREQDVQTRTQEAQRDREVATLDRERRVAISEANAAAVAGEAAAEAQKRVRIAETNADAVKGETQAKAQVAESEASLAVTAAEARKRAETARAIADGQVAEATAKARETAALAEARQIEASERARLEAPAKAVAATAIVAAEGEARQVTIAADAAATAVKTRLEAEAEGQYALLSQRARGLKELVEAAGSPEQAFALLLVDMVPTLVEKAAEAVKGVNVEKVIVWDSGNGSGAGGGVSRVTNDLVRSVPPAMDLIRHVTGIELPGLGKLSPEMANKLAQAMEATSSDGASAQGIEITPSTRVDD